MLTTHYLDEAEALADRAAILVGGRIVECGALAELGGRADTPATVTFRRVPGLGALPRLPGDPVLTDERATVEVRTHTPTAVLAALLPWARAAGVDELPSLCVHQPTLEEIYLDLIREDRATGDAQS